MWDFLFQHLSQGWGFISSLSIQFLEIFFVALAVVFYGYSFFNPEIPKFVVAPVVSVLLVAATYLYTQEQTTKYQQALCDTRFTLAQKEANDKELKAVVKLNELQNKYDNTVLELQTTKVQQQKDLEEALKHPTFDNPTGTPPDVDIPPMQPPNPQIIIDANSCLDSRIPSNVLRALNGNRSSK